MLSVLECVIRYDNERMPLACYPDYISFKKLRFQPVAVNFRMFQVIGKMDQLPLKAGVSEIGVESWGRSLA
jgi:hypothetical protein